MEKKKNEKNIGRKIEDFFRTAFIVVMMLLLFGAGVYNVLVYGIPLGNHEKDMHQVLNGIGMIGGGFFLLLCAKLMDMFFTYLDSRNGDFSKEINPKKWPSPRMRTVNRTLIYMTRRVYLFVWDLVTGLFIFLLVFVDVCMIMENKVPMNLDFGSILFAPLKAFVIFFLPVRIGIVIFYYYRKYTKKMLHYTEKYVKIRDPQGFVKKLEKSLKEDLLYYSHQWIITKDYFMAYCETDGLFHPIGIPVNEMVHLQYEVRTREAYTGSGRVPIESAVIVCRLRSGESVDLYVGNRTKIGTIWKVLEYFKIPYENKMNPNEHFEEPYEITVTAPSASNLSGLEAVIAKMDRRDIEKIYQLLESGQKIVAINEIREITRIGLADAKKIADDYEVLLGDRRR